MTYMYVAIGKTGKHVTRLITNQTVVVRTISRKWKEVSKQGTKIGKHASERSRGRKEGKGSIT